MIMPIRLCDCGSSGAILHGVASVMLGLRQRALAEQEERQRLGGGKVVGIEPHDPLPERLGRAPVGPAPRGFPRAAPAPDVQRRALEQIDEQRSAFVDLAAAARAAPARSRSGSGAGFGQAAVASSEQQRSARSPLPQAHGERRSWCSNCAIRGTPTAYSKASPRPVQDRGVMLITAAVDFSALDFATWSALGDMTQSGANTVITLNASDTVTLTNVTMSNLSSSQFHFV